jgi:hypothetical protein
MLHIVPTSWMPPRDVAKHFSHLYTLTNHHQTTRFGQIRPERSQVLTKEESPFLVHAVNATCNTRITPDCLSELYKFKNYKPNAEVNATISVSGFLEQYFRFADYERFTRIFAPKAANTVRFVSVNGMRLVAANLSALY